MATAWRLAQTGAAIVLGLIGGWSAAKVADEGAPALWYAAMLCVRSANLWVQCVAIVALGAAARLGGLSLRRRLGLLR